MYDFVLSDLQKCFATICTTTDEGAALSRQDHTPAVLYPADVGGTPAQSSRVSPERQRQFVPEDAESPEDTPTGDTKHILVMEGCDLMIPIGRGFDAGNLKYW